ncbi:TolC family protein [bacterium]|nr:TolC family protein [candidate division CSSED10-310 bacterium]
MKIPTKLKIYWLSVILIVSPIMAALAKPDGNENTPLTLSLSECIERAFATSADLEYSKNTLSSHQERIRQARLDRWPTTTMSLSKNKIIDVEDFSYYDPQTGQVFIPGEGYEFAVSLTAPIYTGGRLSGEIDQARAAYMSNSIDYKTLERNLWMDVVATYVTALEQRAEKSVRIEQVAKAVESLKLAETRLAAGQGIRYDVMLEKAYLADARLELVKSENAYQDALRSLLLLIHEPLDLEVSIENISVPEQKPAGLEMLIQQGLENREDIQKIQTEINALNASLKILESSRKPTFEFFAEYGKQGQSLSDINNDDNRVTAGISVHFSPFWNSTMSAGTYRDRINSNDYMQRNYLSLNLMDGSSRLADVMESEFAIRKNELLLVDLKHQIILEISEAFERQHESEIALEAKTLQLDASEENFAIEQKRNELGLNQYKDVVDARTDVISARINLNYAMYRYAYDRARLEYVLGNTPWR